MPTRTSHRSTTGTKLSAKRNAKGQITDIQTYKRAHGQDIKRSRKDERSKTSRQEVSEEISQEVSQEGFQEGMAPGQITQCAGF